MNTELLSEDDLYDEVSMVHNNPKLLLNRYNESPVICEQIMMTLYSHNDLRNIIRELMEQEDKIPQNIYDMAYKYIPIDMVNHASEDAIYNTSQRTLNRLLNDTDSLKVGINYDEEVTYPQAVTILIPRINLDDLLKQYQGRDQATILSKIVKKSQGELLEYMNKYIFDDNITADIATADIIEYFINNSYVPNRMKYISYIYNNTSNMENKEKINDFYKKNQYFDSDIINYLDKPDEYAILTAIGNYYNKNDEAGLKKFKEYLVSSGKMGAREFNALNKYYIQAYEHGLDNEITFD